MAIEEGGMFRCDRSPQAHKDGKPHNEFLNPTDKRRSDWLEVSWEDVMGVTIKYLICPECRKEYEAIRQEQRQKMQNYMYLGQ
jgi:hypothetical protein